MKKRKGKHAASLYEIFRICPISRTTFKQNVQLLMEALWPSKKNRKNKMEVLKKNG